MERITSANQLTVNSCAEIKKPLLTQLVDNMSVENAESFGIIADIKNRIDAIYNVPREVNDCKADSWQPTTETDKLSFELSRKREVNNRLRAIREILYAIV